MTEALKKVYFLGIGGIGMSALARFLKSTGVEVHGYDKTPSVLTAELEAEGMKIHYEDRPDLIPEDTGLIIYTPAVPTDLEEYKKAASGAFSMMKRSELLGVITAKKRTLAVAGTHGKTTVSSMLAHIMHTSVLGCTAFLGGIAKNYDSNLLLNPESDFMVTEADEFDRSFLTLSPHSAVITSADADHLDIYHTHQGLKASFSDFTSKIRDNGHLVIKHGVDLELKTTENVGIYTYSLDKDSDFAAQNIRLTGRRYSFDIRTPNWVITGLQPPLPGIFNIENSVAAAAVAWLNGVCNCEIKEAINSFTGVRRRFDHRVISDRVIYIDDYAHHPEELKACFRAVRALYPDKQITAIFQPHLYTRTRDFADAFAESLSMPDRIILLDIYPARELPIEGVSSAMLLDKITIGDKQLSTKEGVLELIDRLEPGLLLTMGAGNIDRLVEPITELLNKKGEK